jgi:hypothetical protein
MMLRLLARESLRRRQSPSSTLVARNLVTSKQKRSLQESQIHGETTTNSKTGAAATVPPPVRSPPPTPTAVPKSSSGGGSSSSSSSTAVPIAIVLGVGAVGASYYYYTTTLVKSDGSAEKSSIDEAASTSQERSTVDPKTATPAKDEVKTSSSSKSKDDSPSSAAVVPKQQEQPKEGDATVVTATSTTTATGNRVAQIPASSKMRNIAAVFASSGADPITAGEPDHPEAGHRVTTLLPEKKKPDPIETSVTDAAIAALQRETSVTTARALVESHSNLALTTIQELDEMKEVPVLKAKILQLSSELQDRTKWEAVRLKEFLLMKEKEVAEK